MLHFIFMINIFDPSKALVIYNLWILCEHMHIINLL